MGVGYSIMALGGAELIKNLGYEMMFLTGAGTVAAAAIVFGIYFRSSRGDAL
jgi:hypothetical protein